jgi:tetratricopeptide (TPR) repeat protein
MDTVRYLYRSGQRQSAQAFAQRFVDQWTKDSGPDHPTVLDAKRHLGNALRDMGRYSASFPIISDTLERSRRILGERNLLTLTLSNSFAADLRARGDFAAARERDTESLRLHTEALGELSGSTLRVKTNLSLDFGLTSDWEGAQELADEAFRAQNSTSSPDVSETDILVSWSALARALRLCGRYGEARDVGQEAADYGRAVLGAEHYWTMRTLNDLSITLRLIASQSWRLPSA